MTRGLAPPPGNRKVPERVRAALSRALAMRPSDRWPAIADLLDELARDPAAARRRLFAIVAVSVAAIATPVAFVAGRQAGAPPTCSGGEELVAPLWDDAARARVAAAFDRTGRPHATDTFARVDAALRGRLGAWAGAQREACEATRVRHEQSDTLLDLRLRCLTRRKEEIAAVVSLLEDADVGVVDRATQAAAAVGDVGACSDVASLAAAVPPPGDRAVADKVDALLQDVARVEAMRHLGKWKEGLAASRDLIARVRPVGYAPLLARALAVTAMFEINSGDADAGIERLYETARAASEAKDDSLVARSLSDLVFALASRKQRFEAAEVAYRIASAATARAGNTPDLLIRLFGYRAQALFRQGNYTAALPLRYLVLALTGQVFGAESTEMAMQLGYTAATIDRLGRAGEAAELYRRSVAVGEKAVGPEHPLMALLLNNYAANRLDTLDFDAAAALLERVVAIEERMFLPDDPTLAEGLHNLGTARYYQRRLPAARALVERAVKMREAKLGPDHPKVAESYARLASITRMEGDAEEAHRLFQKALAIQHRTYGPAHPNLVETYRGDAAALEALGKLPEARAAVERAMDIDRQTIGETNPDHAESLTALGNVLRRERRFADAVAVYRCSLVLMELQHGPDGPALADTLLALCDALAETGDVPGALAACERASALAPKAPAEEVGVAAFQLAKARWLAGGDRGRAVALARTARADLAALSFPSEDLPRIDRWLATRSR